MMKMTNLTLEEATTLLNAATYLQPKIDKGDKTVHFGIDQEGREFIMILAPGDQEGKVGYF